MHSKLPSFDVAFYINHQGHFSTFLCLLIMYVFNIYVDDDSVKLSWISDSAGCMQHGDPPTHLYGHMLDLVRTRSLVSLGSSFLATSSRPFMTLLPYLKYTLSRHYITNRHHPSHGLN